MHLSGWKWHCFTKDSYKENNSIVFDSYDAVVLTDHDKGFISEKDIKKISNKHKLVFLQSNKLIGDWARMLITSKLIWKNFFVQKIFFALAP